MRNKIYSFVWVGRLQCHNYKIRNNRLALALVLFHSLYTYRSIDKHLPAWLLLFEIRTEGK